MVRVVFSYGPTSPRLRADLSSLTGRVVWYPTEDTCIKCLLHFNSQFTVNMFTGSNYSWQQPLSTPQTMLRYTITLCRVAYPLNNGCNTYRAVVKSTIVFVRNNNPVI